MDTTPEPIPEADEADLAEQQSSVADEPGEMVVSKDDANEADILEQGAIVEDDEDLLRDS